MCSTSDDIITIFSPAYQSTWSSTVIVVSPTFAVVVKRVQVGFLGLPWISKVHSWQPKTLFPNDGICTSSHTPLNVMLTGDKCGCVSVPI